MSIAFRNFAFEVTENEGIFRKKKRKREIYVGMRKVHNKEGKKK